MEIEYLCQPHEMDKAKKKIRQVLRELKINNLHLMTITGSSFTDKDIKIQ